MLLHLITSAGIPATESVGFPHITLIKMGHHDDLKAFLALFQLAVEAWVWPDKQRAAHLLPLLTSKVQLAAQQLLADNWLEYADLKHTFLQRAGCTLRNTVSTSAC